MFGYHGRYLRIDLTRRASEWVPLPESVLRRFLGGVGLATYLMHREAPPRVDPLAPQAPISGKRFLPRGTSLHGDCCLEDRGSS